MNCCEERTDDEHEQSSMCAKRTRPLLERFSVREQFLSDTSDLRTDDLMILCMLVIFKVDEKHVIQVFCLTPESDNIKHILFKLFFKDECI